MIMDKKNIIIEEEIVRSMINKLSELRESQNDYTGITLWSSDLTINGIIQMQAFQDRLSAELANHSLRSFAKMVVFAFQDSNSYITVHQVNTKHGLLEVGLIPLLPRITARTGSLRDAVYVLDKTHQNKWDIGRGVQKAQYYGVDTDNYIVIDDKEKDPEKLNINNHVSSFHANITYENNEFYLQADKGGKDDTRLIQDGHSITLRTGIKVPLHDGALIKLGSVDHYVMLQFKLI